MKAVELIEKLMTAKCDFAEPAVTKVAISAFLANLAEQQLRIEFPKECIPTESINDIHLFYAGVIVGYAKEIGQEEIREAHLALTFPANRAILSRLLYGPGNVTPLGVPVSYGV